MNVFDIIDLATARSVITVIALFAFLAIVFWAYSDSQRGRFESAARLPFEEDDGASQGEPR